MSNNTSINNMLNIKHVLAKFPRELLHFKLEYLHDNLIIDIIEICSISFNFQLQDTYKQLCLGSGFLKTNNSPKLFYCK